MKSYSRELLPSKKRARQTEERREKGKNFVIINIFFYK